INVPSRGLGEKTLAELWRWAQRHELPPYEALERLATGDGSINGKPAPFTSRARVLLGQFVQLIEELRAELDHMTVAEVVDAVLGRTGYGRMVRDGSEEGEERWANLVQLRAKAAEYDELEPGTALPRFLEEVSLVQDVDNLDASANAVTLITLHAAKGLEFPCVFILGLEEGLCPHVRSMDSTAQMEEERRLFFVGITRAMRDLYLLYAYRRGQYGGEAMESTPSRFLSDIPEHLVRRTLGTSTRSASALRFDVSDEPPITRRAPRPSIEAPRAAPAELRRTSTPSAPTIAEGAGALPRWAESPAQHVRPGDRGRQRAARRRRAGHCRVRGQRAEEAEPGVCQARAGLIAPRPCLAMGEGGTVRCGRRRRGIFRALLLAAALLGLGAGVLPAASAPPSAAGAAGQPAGPDWASLGLVAPLWVARSTPIVGQSFASVAGRIAYCAPGGIPLSRDGGATWTIISTAPVLQAAATSGYPLLTTGDVPPACTALALDPTYPDSLYAVFPSARGPYGAPPIIFVGYHTADGGQGWQPIPTPPGIDREQFGGFQVDGTAVQALFARPASTAGTPPGFLLEQTADGGQSWASPPLVDCPATGPCVRWGPAPNAIGSCAMHARIQPVEVSSDGGQSWSPAGFGGEAVETGLGGVNACALNELAALAEREVLLLTGDALAAGGSPAEPVRLS